METPTKTTGIGIKEQTSLKPAQCIVVNADIEQVGEKKANKAFFMLKHPDKQEPVKISSVILMRKKGNKKEIVTVGTWFNQDEDGKLQKGSALAECLSFYKANNLLEMIDKRIDTDTGNDNYLAIKAY